MKNKIFIGIIAAALVVGCEQDMTPTSTSGVKKTEATVKVGSDGLTNEQRNIRDRLELENQPGSIKHLYIIAPESGQCILYSTVKGKVTSSGKRISPTQIDYVYGAIGDRNGWEVKYGNNTVLTREPLQDGTYGSSEPYIYWFDVRGSYHQHFFTGGQIIHISDQPMAMKSIVINIEEQK